MLAEQSGELASPKQRLFGSGGGIQRADVAAAGRELSHARVAHRRDDDGVPSGQCRQCRQQTFLDHRGSKFGEQHHQGPPAGGTHDRGDDRPVVGLGQHRFHQRQRGTHPDQQIRAACRGQRDAGDRVMGDQADPVTGPGGHRGQ